MKQVIKVFLMCVLHRILWRFISQKTAGGLDTLLKLYKFGVINFDRFSSCALRIAGMDQDTTLPKGKSQIGSLLAFA